MRLIVNATPYADPPGGAGLRARYLYGALQERGHELLFCMAEDTPADLAPPGAEVRRLPVHAGAPRRRFLRLRLPDDGDVLLTDHYPVGAIPTIVTLHDLGGGAVRRALIRRCARRAAAAVAVSRTVAEAWGVEADVVPNGFDPPRRRPATEGGGALLVSDPGLQHKNVPVAREAARLVGLPVREVGRGARWLGRDDMQRAIAGARAVLCPSRREGFGMLALEAMALGVPVVASDIPAHREVLGDVGHYAPLDDVAAFASALSRAVQPDRERLQRGRERARAFTWAKSAELLDAVVRRVAR